MIQNHVKEEQKKEKIGKEQIHHYGYCNSCDAKTKESGYVLKGVKAPNGKFIGKWPLYEVPFKKDCEIKKELIDGWFDTRCMRTTTMIAWYYKRMDFGLRSLEFVDNSKLDPL